MTNANPNETLMQLREMVHDARRPPLWKMAEVAFEGDHPMVRDYMEGHIPGWGRCWPFLKAYMEGRTCEAAKWAYSRRNNPEVDNFMSGFLPAATGGTESDWKAWALVMSKSQLDQGEGPTPASLLGDVVQSVFDGERDEG